MARKGSSAGRAAPVAASYGTATKGAAMPNIGIHSTVTPSGNGAGQMTVSGTLEIGGTWSTTLKLVNEDKSKSAETTLAPPGKKLQFLLVSMTSDDPEGTEVTVKLEEPAGGAGGSRIEFKLDTPLLLAGEAAQKLVDKRTELTATITKGKAKETTAEVRVLAAREA